MPKWTKQEEVNIVIVRKYCDDLLKLAPNYPEVVGDRKIVRFLRGHNQDIEKVCNMMSKFLKWRKDNNVDEIRKNIVENGFDHPSKFPKADIILSLIPQLVIIPHIMDNYGCPICIEQYNFVPSEILKQITISEYVTFVIYSLEFKSLVLDQLSHQREQDYLSRLSPEERAMIDTPESTLPPYGILANICVIRDLNGVGFAHLGQQGQEIIKCIVNIASDNYPELMRKCFMINTPFVFNAVWYIVKGWLAPRTIAKVSVRGNSFIDELLTEINKENLPVMVGGDYNGYKTYESYRFDLSYLIPLLHSTVDLQVQVIESEENNLLSSITTTTITTSNEMEKSVEDTHIMISNKSINSINDITSIDNLTSTATINTNKTINNTINILSDNTVTTLVSEEINLSVGNNNINNNKELEVNVISLRTSGF